MNLPLSRRFQAVLALIAFLGSGIAVFQTTMPFQFFWRLLIVGVIVGFIATVREKKAS